MAAKVPGAMDIEEELCLPEAVRAYFDLEVDVAPRGLDVAAVPLTVQLQRSGESKNGQVPNWTGPGLKVLSPSPDEAWE
jgi:hypothetical protein